MRHSRSDVSVFFPKFNSRDCGDSPSPGSHLAMRSGLSPQAGRGENTKRSASGRGEIFPAALDETAANGLGLEPWTPPHLSRFCGPFGRIAAGPFCRWFAGRGWSPREHQLALLEKARDDRSALLIAPTGAGKTLAGFLPTLWSCLPSPLPPRAPRVAGSEASKARSRGRGGGRSAGSAVHTQIESVKHPHPRPSPPLRGGSGAEAALTAHSLRRVISTGRSVKRTGGLHTLYISPLKALAVDIARNLETRSPRWVCRSRSRPAPATTPVSRRQRQRRYPPDILLTTRSNWRCCCRPTTRHFCSPRSSASCSTSCTRW